MRVLVTGAASGIGAAIVRRFVQDGAELYAVDLDPELLATLRGALRDDGLDVGRVTPLVCDLPADPARTPPAPPHRVRPARSSRVGGGAREELRQVGPDPADGLTGGLCPPGGANVVISESRRPFLRHEVHRDELPEQAAGSFEAGSDARSLLCVTGLAPVGRLTVPGSAVEDVSGDGAWA